MIRFLRCWRDITTVGGLVAAAISCRLPCYATGRHRESGFYAWTIANVKKGAPRGWAAVVFMYFFTCYAPEKGCGKRRRYAKLRYDDYLSPGRGRRGRAPGPVFRICRTRAARPEERRRTFELF